MAREVMDNFEDHINSIRMEWSVMKEKWFVGENMDPVFEGVVRDFCAFDDTMHNVHKKVDDFMRGVNQLATGMIALSEGITQGMAQTTSEHLISSDSCKLKEATNQIARADAPHSAIAKLKRDMHFNVLTPVQNHIANNRNLKVSLDVRRRSLSELNTAKKQFEDVQRRNYAPTDKRYLQARSTFESAKETFNEVDRHVFEWLYILEEYRGDIMDSTLQTLKYLEYEFFASSAHAISVSLPSRMEFRPMVEMTPEHLEAQVEMELQKSEDNTDGIGGTGAAETAITDFSQRLIDKKAREDPDENDSGPVLPCCPLSLSSLLSQGFEEGPARKALRKHGNDTQAALDWLINGASDEAEKRKQVAEGVRMPTTVKRVQKLKAMRRAQQDKLKEKQKEAEGRSPNPASSSTGSRASKSPKGPRDAADDVAPANGTNGHQRAVDEKDRRPPPAPVDMLGDLLEVESGGPAKRAPPPPPPPLADLLALDSDEPAVPTDFTKQVERTELPAQLMFDTSKCEMPPLSAAVAAGIAQPRECPDPFAGPGVASVPSPAAAPVAGVSPEVLAVAQARAAQAQISPEQLLLAAQQLSAAGALPTAGAAQPSQPLQGSPQALDPFGAVPSQHPAPAKSPSPKKDSFDDLLSFG
mmetsp:Transcript_95077/g.245631  ORF Transcript_95077/g.245631 Transcript_95077/m.245631 type:complete len:641 (-) Transcript_95077:131-2053(-)